jgi:hypothetical protein
MTKEIFSKRQRERERDREISNMAISPPHMYLACTGVIVK